VLIRQWTFVLNLTRTWNYFINRSADFHLAEVRPLQLDEVVHGDRRTHGASVRKIQVVGYSTFVLSVENDNDFRSRCE
jgi:hypothetical protein